jgi:hypothetical protein
MFLLDDLNIKCKKVLLHFPCASDAGQKPSDTVAHRQQARLAEHPVKSVYCPSKLFLEYGHTTAELITPVTQAKENVVYPSHNYLFHLSLDPRPSSVSEK